MAQSRIINGAKKRSERARRERLLIELVRSGKPPYTPTILSWLSHHLDKPANRITTDDISALLAKADQPAK